MSAKGRLADLEKAVGLAVRQIGDLRKEKAKLEERLKTALADAKKAKAAARKKAGVGSAASLPDEIRSRLLDLEARLGDVLGD